MGVCWRGLEGGGGRVEFGLRRAPWVRGACFSWWRKVVEEREGSREDQQEIGRAVKCRFVWAFSTEGGGLGCEV